MKVIKWCGVCLESSLLAAIWNEPELADGGHMWLLTDFAGLKLLPKPKSEFLLLNEPETDPQEIARQKLLTSTNIRFP